MASEYLTAAMPPPPNILVVDDPEPIRRFAARALKEES
jgi:hypothetical protein